MFLFSSGLVCGMGWGEISKKKAVFHFFVFGDLGGEKERVLYWSLLGCSQES
jgi:hypothetical protein